MSLNSNTITYKTNSGTQSLDVRKPVHNVDGIPEPITQLTLGGNLVCYGLTVVQINGRIIESYKHFTIGDYILNPPLLFKSFHAEIVSPVTK